MNDINSLLSELQLKLSQAQVLLSNLDQGLAHQDSSQTPFVFLFTVFILAVFVGYFVVWSVTPALHSPLMSVTNAISSVIIVGALIGAGHVIFDEAKIFGLIAVFLASVNICGGFIVTRRMLKMFDSRPKSSKSSRAGKTVKK